MELEGSERIRYFAPTAICCYLAVLCAALITTSLFLVTMQDAVAVTAAGVLGLMLSGGLALVFWWAQRRDLRYLRVVTASDARSNFEAVRSAAHSAGWSILREDPGRQLDAHTAGSSLNRGERIAVRFRECEVLVASICDPNVGFSLTGRRHCEAHRELVRRAVLASRVR
jgi:hypothetical protein